jgi:hypothetical protein
MSTRGNVTNEHKASAEVARRCGVNFSGELTTALGTRPALEAVHALRTFSGDSIPIRSASGSWSARSSKLRKALKSSV